VPTIFNHPGFFKQVSEKTFKKRLEVWEPLFKNISIELPLFIPVLMMMLTEKLTITKSDTETSIIVCWLSNLLTNDYVLGAQYSHYPLSLSSMLDIILQTPTRDCIQPLIQQLIKLIKPEAAQRSEKFLLYMQSLNEIDLISKGDTQVLSLEQLEDIISKKLNKIESIQELNWKKNFNPFKLYFRFICGWFYT